MKLAAVRSIRVKLKCFNAFFDFPRLYSNRMYKKLLQFEPNASEEVQIASKAQHICRWKVARESYPMDRIGYLKWREDLKKFHAKTTAEILAKAGYDQPFIDRVSFLIEKKLLKKDAETQLLAALGEILATEEMEGFRFTPGSEADELMQSLEKPDG